MSSVFIVGIIIVVLVMLVSYAFVFQTMDNKKKQRQRLLTALKQRVGNFKYMLSGFPEGFLTKDLTVLVYRCLIDVTEQISRLDDKNPTTVEELQTYRAQLTEAQGRSDNSRRVHLENPKQIKEVRTQLQELHKFIEKLANKGTINSNQAKGYSKQVAKLILQISVDGYLTHAKQAQGSGKTRLAAHYYTLARKLLVRENSQKTYSKQIEQLDGAISRLEEKLKEEASQPPPDKAGAPPANKEWADFQKEEDGWKKKTVYD
ncbi:hypothetical protein [Aurantivibrio plasticivorans]